MKQIGEYSILTYTIGTSYYCLVFTKDNKKKPNDICDIVAGFEGAAKNWDDANSRMWKRHEIYEKLTKESGGNFTFWKTGLSIWASVDKDIERLQNYLESIGFIPNFKTTILQAKKIAKKNNVSVCAYIERQKVRYFPNGTSSTS